MFFVDYKNEYLPSESQVDLSKSSHNPQILEPFKGAMAKKALFEVEDYSFDIENTLNIGSQSTGIGAGKPTFNPFSITRKIDRASPIFYEYSCAGKSFKNVWLGMRKSAGTSAAGEMFLSFTFKLVGVKTVSWAHDDESPKETVTFEFGAMVIQYAQQKADGTFMAVIPKGWNRVKNIAQDNVNTDIE